ncbi:hypothetical protein SDC9_183555 [bioreactor metagenome]|uniref:Uncharacterized protein n=1 Tax=bioreactor metagenome TaxID=1076179 RepID=A0A645HBF8_9ZZZZ
MCTNEVVQFSFGFNYVLKGTKTFKVGFTQISDKAVIWLGNLA